METFYLILVGVLFLLAISDLIVGVSNDAVNFLNSAVGSKVASFKVIIIIAGLGVLVGAVFSSGMMEVARKGIFHPQMFYFSEIMLIFLAVMTTDIIILDTFNTFGMLTSTTVSIVFELLGASVGMASIKLMSSPASMASLKKYLFENHLIESVNQSLNLGDFINSSQALAIISGILFSVAVAFIVGAVIQYLSRIIFSFNYKKRIKWFGGLWGGLAFTSITYFIVIKGANGASFMSADTKLWMHTHTMEIMIYSFILWSVFLQLLNWLFKVNILKTIVIVGTFSLALAWAGNDLVNFIGVPIAAYNSFEIFSHTAGANPNTFLMLGLAGKVATPTFFLLLAGLVLVLTLAFSRKAKSVIKTSVDLSRQETGDERFKPTVISKTLVRSSINFSKSFRKVIPAKLTNAIDRQFEPQLAEIADKDAPAFDLIRASVNLVVASLLIAFGTSLTLPLSTTYVTFMVAMGSSLSDKAWDRESAVYRISGVFAVIGGWFLTAFVAFTFSFIVLYLFYYGGEIAILFILLLVAYLVYRSHKFHNKKFNEDKTLDENVYGITEENVSDRFLTLLVGNLKRVIREYRHTVEGLETEDVKKLRKTKKAIDEMATRTKYIKDHINIVIERLDEMTIDSGSFLVQAMDYMREMVHSISFFSTHALEHVDNNHKPLVPEQIEELKHLAAHIETVLKITMESIVKADYSIQKKLLEEQAKGLIHIEDYRKNQIQRIKKKLVGTRNSILFLNLLDESKNLLLQVVNLFKAQRDFVNNSK